MKLPLLPNIENYQPHSHLTKALELLDQCKLELKRIEDHFLVMEWKGEKNATKKSNR